MHIYILIHSSHKTTWLEIPPPTRFSKPFYVLVKTCGEALSKQVTTWNVDSPSLDISHNLTTCSAEGREPKIYNRYVVLIFACLSLLNLDLVRNFITYFYTFYHLLLTQSGNRWKYVTVRVDWHRLSSDRGGTLSSISKDASLHHVTWGR